MFSKRYFISLLSLVCFVLSLQACSTIVQEKKTQSYFLRPEAPRVLIFPWPIYENISWSAWVYTNLQIYEVLSNALESRGFQCLPFEEVLKLLEEKEIVHIKKSTKISPTILALYEDPTWSEAMHQEIERIIHRELLKENKISINFGRLNNLSEKEFLELAKKKKADYVIRGRITQYHLREVDTLNPFKIGFLGAFTKSVSRLLYGVPKDNKYQRWQQLSVGFMVGAWLGSNFHTPFEPPTYETVSLGHPLLGPFGQEKISGTDDYDLGNALVWGLLGGTLSYLASHGGYAPEAVLCLTLSVYDVKAQQLIWSGRTQIKVAPESIFASHQDQYLLNKALEEALSVLMQRFWLEFEEAKIHVASSR